MFKVGDILKANLVLAENEYKEWKGSQVYTNMMKAAESIRFQVTGVNDSVYTLLRNSDNEIITKPKDEVHKFLINEN